ncbi:MAG: hypothetical protein EHM20_04700 [Alphaproteobacteria bacterium]|nr:MAG: hypothetical protein EHM20_04700 [Alphaproteobacteria bacterium]
MTFFISVDPTLLISPVIMDLLPKLFTSMFVKISVGFEITFIFVLVVHGSTHERVPKGFAGLSIGLALVMIHLIGIPVTGTSVNPARSLGPAIFVGGDALTQLWLFWVAPIIGGIIAALVWRAFK